MLDNNTTTISVEQRGEDRQRHDRWTDVQASNGIARHRRRAAPPSLR
jgi:hypothetical protein